MKKILLFSAALLTAGITFAQTKVGIIAGPNFSSITSKNTIAGSGKETSDILVGLRAGVTADLQLADEFYIGTGLLYAGKGGKNKDNSDVKTTLSYLQIPINFLFKPEVGSGKLNLGAGPYVAYGIGGKNKATVGNVSAEYKAFDDESGDLKLKRFDAGVGVVAGYEFNAGLYLGLNADLGLVNAYEKTDGNRSFKNTSFGVSVGYKF
ncbi:Outer membrane protein beta-barrel domain-containing protein [Chitinophaga sp. YR573]|uniref:porin family protein n=1 Tax=Chitinophaga sp. YR573 TaxID=1881040 RepID=UPI0008C5D104|nr:porin family protein [Chitinophaga sp. YR573]SEW12157.1 Outer membrane protein beta-barrel domain-containing protein [Chitinophaga sp. YR573]